MDDIFSIIFFIWVIYALLEGLVKKNQIPKLPSEQTQQENEESTFKIPTLANDPNIQQLPVPSEEVIQIDSARSVKDIFLQRQAMLQSNSSTNIAPQMHSIEQETQTSAKPAINLNLTPTDTMNAMILSEIFSKPKALRKS